MRGEVNSKSVLAVLRLLPVAASSSRKNVLQHTNDKVESVTLGMSGPGFAAVTNPTWSAPTVFMLLNVWFQKSAKVDFFGWTSIQVNKNFSCARHRDGGNAGTSFIVAVGDFSGGNLLYWPRDDGSGLVTDLPTDDAICLDPRDWQKFDGRSAHETLPFVGERISLVFYTTSTWRKATEESLNVLRCLGTVLPAWD